MYPDILSGKVHRLQQRDSISFDSFHVLETENKGWHLHLLILSLRIKKEKEKD